MKKTTGVKMGIRRGFRKY